MNRGIDHLVLCVEDLDGAASFYERLGFVVMPRAQHDWGTDNRLVQLDGNFLELLTVARPQRIPPGDETHFSFGAHNQAHLARGEGMSMLVFESQDADRDAEEFEARGIGGYHRFDFERAATLPDGEVVTVGFGLAFMRASTLPGCAFFCCQQHAPQYFWKREYQAHPNQAAVIDEVFIGAERPGDHRDFFARALEPELVDENANCGMVARTQRGRVSVMNRAHMQDRFGTGAVGDFDFDPPYFAGYAIRVAALGSVQERLGRAGIPYQSGVLEAAEEGSAGAARLWIEPKHAFGVLIEFHE